ncbi:Endo/exonuclease/phosphatase domain-containing protein [Mycena venus]|uniref:Endo/exonuclease/phosphatase domain-containing protein n=1 Tax=Mycena venus TaxID=2733690 RepID=A0A8H6XWJ4_9AGAR|nr:Endo/exonuclease/phosphatase domain-containing protein [Mycena venus]
MSYLRYDSRPDNITVQQSLDNLSDSLTAPGYLRKSGEQPWSLRRLRGAEHLLGEGLVLAGFQEALVRQLYDLAELFGEDWDWVGVVRDDGVEAGGYSPVFYKKVYSLLAFKPTRKYALHSLALPKRRLPPCLHDNSRVAPERRARSEAQRRHAASMILARARYEPATTGCPVPLDGRDFGAYEVTIDVRQSDSLPADFTAKFSVDPSSPPFVLHDLRVHTPRRAISVNHATFTGLTAPDDTCVWSRVDFLFGGGTGGWQSTGYKVGSARWDDCVLTSDQRPVFADLCEWTLRILSYATIHSWDLLKELANDTDAGKLSAEINRDLGFQGGSHYFSADIVTKLEKF